jgi:AbrB family looped-hinge helix DNA binding protein
MEMAKLTSKGQITIPIGVRRKLSLGKGDKVIFIEQGENFLIVNENKDKFTLSDEQIAAALKKGWSIENIRSMGSIDDPTFVEPPDIPWTPREEFD